MTDTYVPCGLLINGWEYIPEDVFQAHLPFAPPPGVKLQRLYTLREDDERAGGGRD